MIFSLLITLNVGFWGFCFALIGLSPEADVRK